MNFTLKILLLIDGKKDLYLCIRTDKTKVEKVISVNVPTNSWRRLFQSHF